VILGGGVLVSAAVTGGAMTAGGCVGPGFMSVIFRPFRGRGLGFVALATGSAGCAGSVSTSGGGSTSGSGIMALSGMVGGGTRGMGLGCL